MNDGPKPYRVSRVHLTDLFSGSDDAVQGQQQTQNNPQSTSPIKPAPDHAADTVRTSAHVHSNAFTQVADLIDAASRPETPSITPDDPEQMFATTPPTIPQPLGSIAVAPTIVPLPSAPLEHETTMVQETARTPTTDTPIRTLEHAGADVPDMWETAQVPPTMAPITATPTPHAEPTMVGSAWKTVTPSVGAPLQTLGVHEETMRAQSTSASARPATTNGTTLDDLRSRVLQASLRTQKAVPTPTLTTANQETVTPMTAATQSSPPAPQNTPQHMGSAASIQQTDPVATQQILARSPVPHHVVDAIRFDAGTVPSAQHARAIADAAHALANAPTPFAVPSKPTEMHPSAPGHISLEQPQHTASSLPLMRTLRADVEETVSHNRTSLVEMVAAQERQRMAGSAIMRTTPHRGGSSVTTYLLLGASITLVLGAMLVGSFYLLLQKKTDTIDTTQNLFRVETISPVDVSGMDRSATMHALVQNRESVDFKLGSIEELRLFDRVIQSGNEVARTLSAQQVFSQLTINLPSSLARALTSDIMIGVHSYDNKQAFILLRTNYYQGAYAGMIEWESTMNKDLSPFFALAPVVNANTSANQALGAQLAAFTDDVVDNAPVRALKDAHGLTWLLWLMHNKSIVIITTNPETLREVRTRLSLGGL